MVNLSLATAGLLSQSQILNFYLTNCHGLKFYCYVLERRQTMLFSATQTRKIEDLARISLKKEPLYIGVDDQKDKATVEGLEQVDFIYVQSL